MNAKKLGLLAMALVAGVVTLSATQAANDTGIAKLKINTGVSLCEYGKSIDLLSQDVKFNQAYEFSGDFNTITGGTNTWYCTDYVGLKSDWSLTIYTDDLINEKADVISGGLVTITHGAPTKTAGNVVVTASAANDVAINNATTPHVVIAKDATAQGTVGTVTTSGVRLNVHVPANQAPGTYTGTLTITLPTIL